MSKAEEQKEPQAGQVSVDAVVSPQTRCLFCGNELTRNIRTKDDHWFEIRTFEGIHYKCVERLWDIYQAMQKAG